MRLVIIIDIVSAARNGNMACFALNRENSNEGGTEINHHISTTTGNFYVFCLMFHSSVFSKMFYIFFFRAK